MPGRWQVHRRADMWRGTTTARVRSCNETAFRRCLSFNIQAQQVQQVMRGNALCVSLLHVGVRGREDVVDAAALAQDTVKP